MVKRLLVTVLQASVVALVLCAADAKPDASYQTLIGLEAARSLGNGVLAVMLAGNDPKLAARAALAIGRTKDAAGVPLLQGHLNDRNAAVRAMSVYGLGLLATGASAPDIIADTTDAAGAVRVAALDAVGRYESAAKLSAGDESKAAAAVGVSLRADRDPIVRARAATAFEAFQKGRATGIAVRDLVGAWKTERDDEVRWHMMWTMFRAYATQVPRALLSAALHDRSELVRIEAVRAYGKLKDKKLVAAVLPLTRDPSWRVQLQALEAVRALRGEKLTEHLKALPPGIHTPPVRVQTFMEIAPLPRPAFTGKPAKPAAADALTGLKIDPQTAELMDGP
ncbi:MAG: HEAT repeat domain-containing protein, partial [Candidatus Eremiobacteraeota bacterium]|nr:HEAT repeat domain-containing protein [Candidatus Eremiobacteraeota bacterium]